MSIQSKLIFTGLISMDLILPSNIMAKDPKPDTPPNILMIAVDDLRTELGCYGSEHMHTPNIDRLALQGVMFQNAHTQQSICMASRASLMTGIRPENREIYNCKSVEELMPDVVTLNKYFETNGYLTYGVGKIYHYGSDHKRNFEEWFDPTERWAGKGYISDEAIAEMEANGRVNEADNIKGPAYEMQDVPDDYYIDGYNTVHVLKKIKEFKKSKKPFFLAMGFHKPHLPWTCSKKYWDLYPVESIELSPVPDTPEGVTPYTNTNWNELRSYFGMPQGETDMPDELAITLRRAYFASVSYVDAQIGKILDALEKNGLKENTIVILWGDHGWKLGDYGKWSKHTNYTFDTNVPLIISYPGMNQKGVIEPSFAELVDIYPTLCELAGLQTPNHLEGNSLVPVPENPELEKDTVAWSIFPRNKDDVNEVIIGYSMRTKSYRYTEWIHNLSGKTLDFELYDVVNDPYETNNLRSRHQNYKALKKALHLHYDASIPGMQTKPSLVMNDANNLMYSKYLAEIGEEPYASIVEGVVEDAEELLDIKAFSVMNKEKMPPSGDKHDYYSLGVYWWPNPETSDGLPYIRKDGIRNPELNDYDGPSINDMSQAVFQLALGYFFSGNDEFSLKAAELLKTWFLNPETKMNPHLEYGQSIPGICEGRGIGIIESEELIWVVEAIGLLEASRTLTEKDKQGLKSWFKAYSQWLITSRNGWEERMWYNNHGSAYDSQVASFAIFTGQDSVAEMILDSVKLKRIETQIMADGSQPFELNRTKAMSYSSFNLIHLCHNALMAENYDIDLWNYENSRGASILTAFKFLIPFMNGEKEFPYTQLGGLEGQHERFWQVLLHVSEKYNDALVQETLDNYPLEKVEAKYFRLFFPEVYDRAVD
ncbi:MAG: alginate lyase family protein [Bacteroidales bacterium]|nr:alginate lyase family protein [Bacteroidales bacterium]MCF8392117.1 alginate lyase family protein [Bacteroidales bacterium]